jgi:tetratricopeptide (TPR) repeat protein
MPTKKSQRSSSSRSNCCLRLTKRRPRLLGRLGLALAWTLNPDEARKAASEAGDLIAVSEGESAAADYLAEATETMGQAGFMRPAAALASQGLRYAVSRLDDTWVTLTSRDLVREEADDPNYPGIPLDSPRRRELQQVLRIRDIRAMRTSAIEMRFHSREEVLAHAPNYPFGLTFWAGEYRRALPLWEDEAAESERQGRIAVAVSNWAQVARCYNALGDFAAARAAYQKGRTAGSRLSVVSLQLIQLLTARDEMWLALDENWERAIASFESSTQTQTPELNWFLAAFRAARVRIYAHLGKAEQAVDQLKHLVVPLERAPGWTSNYTRMACDAASALWLLGRTDHIEVIERNLRDKVVAPDFRYTMFDARLSLARLCALQGRYDEAAEWFAKSRAVLDEQGARPLRAIADFDEAWMYLRRGAPGDLERARPQLDAAMTQFKSIGMTGWLRRAENLVSAKASN